MNSKWDDQRALIMGALAILTVLAIATTGWAQLLCLLAAIGTAVYGFIAHERHDER